MKINTEIFIEKSNLIHNSKFNYSETIYIKTHEKVKIICPNHGVFEQTPHDHLSGRGCGKCYGRHKDTQTFINEVNKIHNNKYDYSLVEYVNNYTKVKIICPLHGIFEQKPNKHISGCGCNKCIGREKTTKSLIEKFEKIHGNKYIYSMVDYKNGKTKVKIICPTHGMFEQTPESHLCGHGCKLCGGKMFKIDEQHLYIFYDKKQNLYKIGISIDVNRRCIELNSSYYGGIDKQISIIYNFENKSSLEKQIHKMLEEYNVVHPIIKMERLSGKNEWFNVEINKINFILESLKLIN